MSSSTRATRSWSPRSTAKVAVSRTARDLLPDPGRSITSIAKLLGVSPGTLYNHIPNLRELRSGAARSARSADEVGQLQQDQSQRHFLYLNYSHPYKR